MPLQETSGNATTDAYGGGVAAVPQYIEDVFSTYLYTGTGAAQTITNNIDLSTKGGLVWIKDRSNAESHSLWDTARGVSAGLQSNATSAQYSDAISLTAYNSNGFSLGTDANVGWVNRSPDKYVSWTFRKQPKFFDVVTYTGNGSTQNITHNLGSEPGCIIVKKTSGAASWYVYHRSLGDTAYINLNLTSAAATGQYSYFYGGPSSTTFTVNAASGVNESGQTFVAYIYAHNAGGFGLTGTDNVISCGSFTTDATGLATVNLGYEPQMLIAKRSSGTASWFMVDNMRSFSQTTTSFLYPSNSSAEDTYADGYLSPTATGFTTPVTGILFANSTYIYIAIRRGPMKVPTDATTVYKGIARTGTGATANVTGVGFPVDLNWSHIRDAAYPNVTVDRLRGTTITLKPSTTDAEAVSDTVTSFASMDGVQYGTSDRVNASGNTYVNWYFKRAPSFFDEVCYTGTGSARTVTHNLAAVPEMMIVKNRTLGSNWTIYTATTGNGYAMNFDTAVPFADGGVVWNSTTPTSTVFSVATNDRVNGSSSTYVAYLFATCAGVSKVGSYTGNGTTQTINCGFTGGARFVLIKRTDSTGGWYVYDTARGMTVLTDPYLFMNVDAAEVATLGSVTTVSTGFAVNAAILAAINTNGASYIYLSIA